jgi:hypothetical protein
VRYESVPYYFCDQLTGEIMLNPVVLSSGNSYDKASIKQYFKTTGFKDPQSGQEVNGVLVDNRVLKDNI